MCTQTGEDAKLQEQAQRRMDSVHLRFNLMSDANIVGIGYAAGMKAGEAFPGASEDSLPVQDLYLSAGLPHMKAAAAAAQPTIADTPAAADTGVHMHSQTGIYIQQRKAMGWAEQGLPDCCASLVEVAAATGLVGMLNSPNDWDAVPEHTYQACAWWLAVTADTWMGTHAHQHKSRGADQQASTLQTLPALQAHLTLIGEPPHLWLQLLPVLSTHKSSTSVYSLAQNACSSP